MTPAERLVYAAALVACPGDGRDPFDYARFAIMALRDRARRLRLEPDSMLSEFLAGEEKR